MAPILGHVGSGGSVLGDYNIRACNSTSRFHVLRRAKFILDGLRNPYGVENGT
jgi:hypothetical protein